MTLDARVAEGRERLVQAGIPADEAALDARLLAQFVLGWDAATFLAHGDRPVTPDFSRYEGLLERRIRREPLAYIVGHQEFWTLDFQVSPSVLIPRPESELIVESALARSDADARLSIADVGTGSGCLAVTLAYERTDAAVVATDVSAEALSVAQRNAVRHRVDNRVRFIQTDLLKDVDQPFDLIVSNPPYIPRYELPNLQPEVRDYEPAVALLADAGGLAVIRRLVDQSIPSLKIGGFLIFEFGIGQAGAIDVMLKSTKAFGGIQIVKDLQGIPRTAIAERG